MKRPVALQGMRRLVALVVCAVGLVGQPVAAARRQTSAVQHDAAFWSALREAGAPAPDALRPLALELAGYAASTDPVLRDEIGYELTERWVRAGLFDEELLRELVDRHLEHATDGLGEPEGDGVFLRGFSALHLSVLVARDRAQPFLDDERCTAIVETTCALLEHERDRRGWIEGKGWAHVVAHTADVARRLAQGERLDAERNARLVEALEHGLDGPNLWGEGDRVAAALYALARRDDFALEAFDAALERWVAEARTVWSVGPFDPALFRRAENAKQLLRALHVRMAVDPEPPVHAERLGAHVLQALARMP